MRILLFLRTFAGIAAGLYSQRSRASGSSTIKVWARRIQQAPNLVRQAWFQSGLIRGGATLSKTSYFSDPSLIEGRLTNLTVGNETFIGRVRIATHAKLIVGDNVCINDGVHILTATHDVQDPNWRMIGANITIGNHAWIAMNAILLPGVTIGTGAVVGAGAVVAKDVSPYSVVVGNPARPTTRMRPKTLNYSPLSSLALYSAWRGNQNIAPKNHSSVLIPEESGATRPHC